MKIDKNYINHIQKQVDQFEKDLISISLTNMGEIAGASYEEFIDLMNNYYFVLDQNKVEIYYDDILVAVCRYNAGVILLFFAGRLSKCLDPFTQASLQRSAMWINGTGDDTLRRIKTRTKLIRWKSKNE